MQATNGRTVLVQGRIVWTCGDLFEGKKETIFGTNTPKMNKAGEQSIQYGFGLAVPKAAFSQPGGAQDLWAAMHAEAMTLFPSGQIPPSFAMKYKDGDTAVDEKGGKYSEREGYAGHMVFACTTSLAIKFFKFENGNNILIKEGIKCGDYVNVQLTVRAHPAIGSGKAGLYMNPSAVQFLGYGKEIVNTPSGDQIFGTQAPPIPAGASAIPTAPQGQTPLVPTMPGAAPMAQAAVTPHYGVIPGPLQPPPGGVPMAAPMPGVPAAAPAYQQPVAPAPMPGMPAMPGFPQQ